MKANFDYDFAVDLTMEKLILSLLVVAREPKKSHKGLEYRGKASAYGAVLAEVFGMAVGSATVEATAREAIEAAGTPPSWHNGARRQWLMAVVNAAVGGLRAQAASA